MVSNMLFRLKLRLVKLLTRFLKFNRVQSSKVIRHEPSAHAAHCGCTCMFTTYVNKTIVFPKLKWKVKWWEATVWSLAWDGVEWEETFILPNLGGKEIIKEVNDISAKQASRRKLTYV